MTPLVMTVPDDTFGDYHFVDDTFGDDELCSMTASRNVIHEVVIGFAVITTCCVIHEVVFVKTKASCED
jgi:hypothetical protein